MFTIPTSKLEQGRVPKRHWMISSDKIKTLSTRQHQRLRRWVANSEAEAKDLLITGAPRTGKTSLAVLVLKSLAARFDHSIAYVDLRSLPDMHYRRGEDAHAEFYRYCLECDALVIDDCASHKNEGCFLTLDYVYRLRHAAKKITVIVCDEDETFAPVLAAEFGHKFADKVKAESEHISLGHSE